VFGVVLVGLAVGGAAYGARGGGGEVAIAAAAIASVLGMVFLVPVIVAAVARLARRLPLPLRFAARDAARHRTRTVPAVAAVAATVAGVVALGIAVTSDEEESEQTYYASIAMGHGLVSDDRRQAPWDAYQQAVTSVLPDAEVTELRGLDVPAGQPGIRVLEVRSPDNERVLSSYGGPPRNPVLVGTELPPGLPGIDGADRERAEETLAAGGVVAFADRDMAADEVQLRAVTHTRRTAALDPVRLTASATYVTVEDAYSIVQAVVSPEVAERLGGAVTTQALVVSGPISPAEETDVNEAVGAVGAQAGFTVERGYQAPDETVIIQLVLAGLGAVLMLGGTLTATFLALSDARPDLATLSAVGAAPRTRRSVAASYALVVGLVGAVLGALVGAIPGIAITYPVTGAYGPPGAPDHYLDVPWVLVFAVVVGLPVLTALLVGLTARSRLPLVARLE
jgi:putative ABC transport system permease protein